MTTLLKILDFPQTEAIYIRNTNTGTSTWYQYQVATVVPVYSTAQHRAGWHGRAGQGQGIQVKVPLPYRT